MVCYNDPSEQACGTCKNCCKGLCKQCATDLGDGLACNATCVDNVVKVNTLIYKNVRTNIHTSNKYNVIGILYTVLGGLMIGLNLLIFKKTDVFLIAFGVFFLVYGIYTISRGLKINKDDRI